MAVTAQGKANATKIANDESPEKAIEIFNKVMDSLLPATTDNADLYVFTSHQVLEYWLETCNNLSRHGFKRSAILVWQKDGPGMGNLDSWGMGHEFIIFLKKGNRPRSAKRRSGVLEIPQDRPNELIHPHQKPLALLDLLIRHSTDAGDFIVDPFCGSGSTVRAARLAGRSAVGIELDPKRYEIAINKLNTSEDALF